jgi:hypothetical protein
LEILLRLGEAGSAMEIQPQGGDPDCGMERLTPSWSGGAALETGTHAWRSGSRAETPALAWRSVSGLERLTPPRRS